MPYEAVRCSSATSETTNYNNFEGNEKNLILASNNCTLKIGSPVAASLFQIPLKYETRTIFLIKAGV